MIKRIGVLTSGGDVPGMNAAIRSVVRTRLGTANAAAIGAYAFALNQRDRRNMWYSFLYFYKMLFYIKLKGHINTESEEENGD